MKDWQQESLRKGKLELYTAARKLIEKPEAWTQQARAKDKYGNFVFPHDYSAIKWSLPGALRKIVSETVSPDMELYSWFWHHASEGMIDGKDSIQEWNDDPALTHTDVIEKLDYIILRLSQ